ncbi:uncharacterized protein BX663DRAFT_549708 [Cokeromyces recurvatus]|uniref:uncharacterized protein n=1 Tax=Cokeromyces recurvatus TaxID=90255 RepID=UPI0022206AD6|nr:uncharacterized protein BX663DRAFT_549708 [Cokeromyces recurvatus]KAI7905744.1 hypothetical protein BX663DRAFT_549708 [Cokeromyces recurvatus]
MSQLSTHPHLQLCVNDLLHPTEKSELLLEALTSSQLEEIERTLSKIKEKKQSSSSSSSPQQKLNKEDTCSPSPIATETANPSSLHHDWSAVAAQIAKALADSITTATNNNPPSSFIVKSTSNHNAKPLVSSTSITGATSDKPSTSPSSTTITPSSSESCSPIATKCTSNSNIDNNTAATAGSVVPNHEPRTEVRDGIEWVSFVYSHHRVLRRYSIRTDVEQVDISLLDDKFKSENCVYPRANLPHEEYKGNRWAYETECNTLGWKLAFLNSSEIAGKRGLIQRAVDSYRNRYPSMRSRRVARQEKLLKGTLRKRKQRESEELNDQQRPSKTTKQEETVVVSHHESSLPKTVSIDDGQGTKYRIRINIDSVALNSIDMEFRKANCVYPRAMNINTSSPFASQRQLEEAKCNELGWKLAWLNSKHLANRKNLLQRVLDVYRSKFMPELNPRKNSIRIPNPPNHLSIDTDMLKASSTTTSLTVDALISVQEQQAKVIRRGEGHDDNESLYSGTTDSLDFHDCFSPHDMCNSPSTSDSSLSINHDLMLSAPTSSDDLLFGSYPLFGENYDSCCLSISSSCSSRSDLAPSPYIKTEHMDDTLFKDHTAIFDLYTADSIQLPSINVDFEQSDYTKTEDDPLMSQLFHI